MMASSIRSKLATDFSLASFPEAPVKSKIALKSVATDDDSESDVVEVVWYFALGRFCRRNDGFFMFVVGENATTCEVISTASTMLRNILDKCAVSVSECCAS